MLPDQKYKQCFSAKIVYQSSWSIFDYYLLKSGFASITGAIGASAKWHFQSTIKRKSLLS